MLCLSSSCNSAITADQHDWGTTMWTLPWFIVKWFQDAGIEASACARKVRPRLRLGTGWCRGLSCIYIITTLVATSLCDEFTYNVLYDQWTRHTKPKIKKWTRHMWRVLCVTSSLVTFLNMCPVSTGWLTICREVNLLEPVIQVNSAWPFLCGSDTNPLSMV